MMFCDGLPTIRIIFLKFIHIPTYISTSQKFSFNTYLSNASGKFVAPMMITPSLGLKLLKKKKYLFTKN